MQNLKTGLGCLSLASMLALMSPGVTIVRAEDSAASNHPPTVSADGATCEAGLPVHADTVIVNHLQQVQRLHARSLAAAAKASDSDVSVVELNTRGYNYSNNE